MLGDAAALTSAKVPTIAPLTITRRGWRSSQRPTGIAQTAEVSSPAVIAMNMDCSSQPVSSAIAGAATRTA